MLQLMKDLALKKKSMEAEESVKNADANAMMKIADSMQMLSQAIMTGFNHLATDVSSRQPFPQHYPMNYPGNFSQGLPCHGNAANLSNPQTSYNVFTSVDPVYGFRSVSPYSNTSTTNSNEDDQ